MQFHFLTLSLLVSAVVASTLSGGGQTQAAQPPPNSAKTPQPPKNQSIRYECLQDGNQFVTIAHTPRGPIEMVTWKSQYFGPQWTPERRCAEVTRRFQGFSDSKVLKFVSYGRLNDYKVLCVSEQSGKCMSESLLLTLEHKDNPVRVLTSLFNYDTMLVRGGKTVINIDEILQTRPPRSETPLSPDSQPKAPLSPQSQWNHNSLEVPPIFRGN